MSVMVEPLVLLQHDSTRLVYRAQEYESLEFHSCSFRMVRKSATMFLMIGGIGELVGIPFHPRIVAGRLAYESVDHPRLELIMGCHTP